MYKFTSLKKNGPIKHFLLISLFLVYFGGERAFAQQSSSGKEFYLTFVPNLSVNPACEVILSSPITAQVTISNIAKSFSTTVTVLANISTTVSVPITACIPTTPDITDNFALLITSNQNITVYAVNATAAIADGTLVLPNSILGSTYYVASFRGSATSPSLFVMVALQDSTEIEITPKVKTKNGQPAGVPYNIMLNKGETHMVFADTGDISGTKVMALGNKKISVFAGSKCINVPSNCAACDLLYEHLPPVTTWGKTFFMAPPSSSTVTPMYGFRVIAAFNSTTVTVNGIPVVTLNAGDVYTSLTATGPTCITTTKQALVVQYMLGTICVGVGDPSIVVIPPAEQAITRANFSTATYATFLQHYIYVVVKNTATASVKLDGSFVSSASFQNFTCGTYSYANISLTPGSHLIESDSSFMLVAYGYGTAISYAFIGGSNFKNLSYDIDIKNLKCGVLDYNIVNTGDTAEMISSVWYFGDSTTATGKNVQKTYAQHGTYTIKNIVSFGGDAPFSATLTKTFKTLEIPKADFSINSPSQCITENAYTFKDSSAYFNGSFKTSSQWWFSDTTWRINNSVLFNRKFYKEGTVKVRLRVTSNEACADTMEKTITVMPSAYASIDTALPQCFKNHIYKPTAATFINTPGSISGYQWNFGDGFTDTGAFPSKIYTDTGTYTIQLVAQASNGCNDTTTNTFTVLPSPVTDFTAPTVCFKDSTVFKNTAFIKKGILKYAWNYGDSHTDIVLQKNRLYADTGSYTVSLFAVSENGCSDSVFKTVKILPKPLADFTVNGNCVLNPVLFTDATTRFGIPVLHNQWGFGDGVLLQNTGNAQHTYAVTGMQNIKLVTRATNGCADSITKKAYINPIPEVSFGINDSAQCLKNNRFDFINSTTIPQGGISAYYWQVGTTALGSGTYVAPSAGDYTIQLGAISDSLCADSATKTITAHPQTDAKIAVNDAEQCLAGNSFVFTNNSALSAGTFTSQWILSTPASFTTHTLPAQQFAAPGSYTLLFITTTDKGCKDSVQQNLTVNFTPKADFTVAESCQADSAQFDNITPDPSGEINQWQWRFGDGKSSSFKNPYHHYASAGLYTVSLKAETDKGCKDSIEKTGVALVHPNPKSYFTFERTNDFGQYTTYKFHNKSLGAVQYLWDFGNGNTSPALNPEETYGDTGKFTVGLLVENDKQCTHRYDTTFLVMPELQIYIPTAFTPGRHDNLNAVFSVEGVYYLREFEMILYNRWGVQVFYSNSIKNGWDGTYEGAPAPDGIYLYHIKVRDLNYKGHIFNGTLTLVR